MGPELVTAVRALHREARPADFADILRDDEFVQTRLYDFVCNIGEDDIFRADLGQRVTLDVEIEREKREKTIAKPRLMTLGPRAAGTQEQEQ